MKILYMIENFLILKQIWTTKQLILKNLESKLFQWILGEINITNI